MSDARPPRRPLSPWPIGAAILGAFVALALFLRDSDLALEIMVAVALLVALLLAFRGTDKTQRQAQTRGQVTPPATGTGPLRVARPAGNPEVMTVEEAAAYLRADVPTVVSEIEAGRIPGNRLGGHWRIRRLALDEWLDGAYRNIVEIVRPGD
jgi:excisionase family DNA binding protein